VPASEVIEKEAVVKELGDACMSATLDEADSRASNSAWRVASAVAKDRWSRDENCGELGSGNGYACDVESIYVDAPTYVPIGAPREGRRRRS
jgi:hypothetical protein